MLNVKLVRHRRSPSLESSNLSAGKLEDASKSDAPSSAEGCSVGHVLDNVAQEKTSMIPKRWSSVVAVVPVVVVLAAFIITMAFASGRFRSVTAAPSEQDGSVPVQLIIAPNTHAAPMPRDATRRTAVFPGLAEVTVLDVRSITGSGSESLLLVDIAILGLTPATFVPDQTLRFELTAANGTPISGMTAKPSLSEPLIGGDDQRYSLIWPRETGVMNLRIWSHDSSDAAVFRIVPGGGQQ